MNISQLIAQAAAREQARRAKRAAMTAAQIREDYAETMADMAVRDNPYTHSSQHYGSDINRYGETVRGSAYRDALADFDAEMAFARTCLADYLAGEIVRDDAMLFEAACEFLEAEPVTIERRD